jgi:hypothetical protein
VSPLTTTERPPAGAVLLEGLEGEPVDGAHALGQALARATAIGIHADPELEAVAEAHAEAPRSLRLHADALERARVAGRRAEGREPAVAVARGAPQRRLGAPADHDRDRRIRGRPDQGLLEREELALQRAGLSREEPAQRHQRFVGAATSRRGVQAADLDLVAILAADADPEDEPPRRRLGERGELARDEHRVAERQQVDADLHAELRRRGEERRGLHEPVHPEAGVEAHVVGDEEVVEAGGGRAR